MTIASFLDSYTGRDIRQAVYAFEYAKTKGRVGYSDVTGVKQKTMPETLNRVNRDQSLPLPGVAPGGLLEFPIFHDRKNGHDGRRPTTDARVITKQNAAGQTELVGKAGHRLWKSRSLWLLDSRFS